jgi:hypothetical protein
MLLNEFIKEHCKVEQQDCKLQERERQLRACKSKLKHLLRA